MSASLSLRPASTPLPYSGPRREILRKLGGAWQRSTHDTDLSGTRTYAFNELGYRGPSFEQGKGYLAFVFGESDAFGMGMEWEDSWCVRAAFAEAARQGFDPSDVMVMNFAESGASNSYIARLVAVQCARVQPDLVIVGLADHGRMEVLTSEESLSCGGWLEGDGVVEGVKSCDELDAASKERLVDGLERASAFRRYSDANLSGGDEQLLYHSAQSLLLIQSVLRAQGTRAVVIGRAVERLLNEKARQHPVLGTMVALLDPGILHYRSVRSITGGERGEDGAHLAPEQHEVVANAAIEHLTTTPTRWPWESEGAAGAAPGKVPDEAVTARVAAFYNELPFNFHGTQEGAAEAILVQSVATHYLDLGRHLDGQEGMSILEFGCGAGWLSHSLHLHHGANVHAVDLSSTAIERARAVGERLGTTEGVRFQVADVLKYETAERYDLAISLGALHHTADPRLGLEKMVAALRPGGHVYLGLYHGPGRHVFLEEMWRILKAKGEDAAFKAYRKLDGVHAKDKVLARSWFRDQVLHPHETQHTLEEVVGWFDELGVELSSTSINGFYPIESHAALFAKEQTLAEVSRKALFEEKRYYPGFFTAFGRLKR